MACDSLMHNHENVVNYWNSIDEKLELEMDVLDDLLSEGEIFFSISQ